MIIIFNTFLCLTALNKSRAQQRLALRWTIVLFDGKLIDLCTTLKMNAYSLGYHGPACP
jgi:hypothetical protein